MASQPRQIINDGPEAQETAPTSGGEAQVTDGGEAQGVGINPLAGVSAASIRITNLYVVQPNSAGAASLSQDVYVSQSLTPNVVVVPVGHSQVFQLSGNTISSIVSSATYAGGTVLQHVDIG